MHIAAQLGWSALIIAIIGLAAHLIGEALPRTAFDWSRPPFAPFSFEQSGAVYRRIKVDSWKSRLPDQSRILRSCYTKAMSATPDEQQTRRLLEETCVAEAVHWALAVVSPLVGLLIRTPLSWAISVVYGLSNLPFIIIQRYNRLRLAAVQQRLQQRAQRVAERRGDVA